MLKPKTTKLYEQITPQIARDIISKRLPAGSTIPSEPQLVVTFGISKTVARETVQTLEAAGLVRVQHGRRTVVLDEQEWDILSPMVQEAYHAENMEQELVAELYEVRMQLEPRATFWAAERASPGEVAQIKAILEKMRGSLTTPQAFLEYDHEFHIAIGNASANRVLRTVLRDIRELLGISWTISVLSPEDVRVLFKQHERICDAICKSNGAEAERAMRQHLEWAVEKDSFIPARRASGATR